MAHQKGVRHLRSEALQLDHAFCLEIPDGIVEHPMLWLKSRPCHQDVLKHPKHDGGVRIKRTS